MCNENIKPLPASLTPKFPAHILDQSLCVIHGLMKQRRFYFVM